MKGNLEEWNQDKLESHKAFLLRCICCCFSLTKNFSNSFRLLANFQSSEIVDSDSFASLFAAFVEGQTFGVSYSTTVAHVAFFPSAMKCISPKVEWFLEFHLESHLPPVSLWKVIRIGLSGGWQHRAWRHVNVLKHSIQLGNLVCLPISCQVKGVDSAAHTKKSQRSYWIWIWFIQTWDPVITIWRACQGSEKFQMVNN